MENPKQQAIERIRTANNVLVTVTNNPSVDQLAAAIGVTLFLNKLGKHATTVFSGQVPSILEFLQPEKTIEKNTDSLRDFIIALDKAKADKLRYKVEDRLVKIFITPYHTSIGEGDLEFSHGDFNVDAVLAIGVQKREELDQAITAHGRILHDATVITMNTQAKTDIGAINWQDPNASSLCELSYGMAESLQADAIDGQMATAFLTGIVAETERFSNAKTSSNAMAISSKLMTAGANQQLVATKLQPPAPKPKAQDDSFKVPKNASKGTGTKKPAEKTIPVPPEEPAPVLPKPVADDGAMQIDHGDKPAQKPADAAINQILNGEEEDEDDVEEVHIDDQGTLKYATDVAREQKAAADAAKKAVEPAPAEPAPAEPAVPEPESQVTSDSGATPSPLGAAAPPPVTPQTDPLGSMPAATNTPILSHNTPLPPAGQAPSLASALQSTSSADDVAPSLTPSMLDTPDRTLTQLEQTVHSPHLQAEPGADAGAGNSQVDQARAAVTNAVNAVPPAPEPISALNAQPIDLAPPPLPPAPTPAPAPMQGPMTEPMAPLPPQPDPYSTGLQGDLPPVPTGFPPANSVPPELPSSLVPPAAPIDPTASPNDASAPPLVPPPMVPPMPPTAPPPMPGAPSDNSPASPPPGNPLFPQP